MKSRNNPAAGAAAAPVRRLIVNADDFGLSPGVNAGIVQAHLAGALTSATLLVNAPFFRQAVDMLADAPRLGVGLHLNLVRGVPLSPPGDIPLLVGGDGRLRPFRWRRLSRAFLLQAEREYRRQFEAILAAGIVPTHIDFEKHHAWQPGLYGLACRLAREYGVPAARNLREPVGWSCRRLGWPGARRAVMAALLRCGASLSAADDGGLARPDRLIGQSHIGAMDEGTWLRLARHLPPGTSEVMTHPGQPEGMDCPGLGAMGGSWLAGRREAELAALLSPAVGEALHRNDIRLVRFDQLVPPAS